MTTLTRVATPADLAWVAPAAVRAHVVTDVAELSAISAGEPWRVRVTERGEAAVVGPWRAHGRDCAVFGLWCAPSRLPLLVTDLMEVAREQGFTRLLGPLVPERDAGQYLSAGLRVVERLVVMRTRTGIRDGVAAAPDSVVVRAALEADLQGILDIDAACFDPFWRYDVASLMRLARTERIVVATVEGRTVGYTLCTLRAGEAGLGRLAVLPEFRRRGIARHLVREALSWSASRGAAGVALSTQEGNTASRSLYRSAGFRETGDVLVVCASDVPARTER